MRCNGFILCFFMRLFNLLPVLFVALFFLGCSAETPQPSEERQKANSQAVLSQVQQKSSKTLGSSLLDHPGFTPRFSGKSSHDSSLPTTKSENMIDGGRVTINEYSFESTKTEDGKVCMTFYRSGKRIRSDCADRGFVDILSFPPPGTDINGDGVPDVIVGYFSGGAHCCSEYAVFSLGKKLKLLDVLNGEHSNFEFKDLDNDGKYEATGRDWTFAYWGTSFAGSPAPEVILRWKNGRYRLAEDLMRRKYARDEVLKIVDDFENDILPLSEDNKSLHVDTTISAAMLELIYTGNGNLAWEFVDRVWPIPDDDLLKKQWLSDKKKFLREFKVQLRKSDYWSDLKIMNGW